MAEFELIRRPRTAKVQHEIVRQTVAKNLEPVAKTAAASLNRVVGNWKNKPKFKGEVNVTEKEIKVEVTITNPGQQVNETLDITGLWNILDKTGAKAHLITPRTPQGLLIFPWGGPGSYLSKTGVSPARFGGPGTIQNAFTVRSRGIEHPGFPARKFSEAIIKDLQPKFNNRVDSGYRKGFSNVS